ncbi:hypothetical protein Hanom_Chr13g01193071 [Helianthus anomalus]
MRQKDNREKPPHQRATCGNDGGTRVSGHPGGGQQLQPNSDGA